MFCMKRNPSARNSSLAVLVLARSDTSGQQKGKENETAALTSPWTAKKPRAQSWCNISKIGVFSKLWELEPSQRLQSKIWTALDITLWYQGVSAQVHTFTLPWEFTGNWVRSGYLCLLMPQVCEQAQVSRQGCHKPLSPSKCIAVSSSGEKEGTILSLQPPKLKTHLSFLLLSNRAPRERKTDLSLGDRQIYTHTRTEPRVPQGYGDRAGIQPWGHRILKGPWVLHPFRRHKVVCSFLTLYTSCTWMVLTVQFVKKSEAQTKHLPYTATWCDTMWHMVPAAITTSVLK